MKVETETEKVNIYIVTCEKCGRKTRAVSGKKAKYQMVLHQAGSRCRKPETE